MTCKSLFQASFEESLNLQDDSISGEFSRTAVTEFERVEANRGKVKSQLIYLIYTLLFVFGLNYLLVVVSDYSVNEGASKSLFEISSINLLPKEIFFVGALLWLFLIIVGKQYQQTFIKPYRMHFHMLTYFFWTILEFQLLFITWFLQTMTLIGIIVFYGLMFFIAYTIFRSRFRMLHLLIYGWATNMRWYDRVFGSIITFLFKYGWGFVAIYFILKFVFSEIVNTRSDWIGLIGMIIMWFAISIGIFVMQVYFLLPHMLQGYYKLKYPEAYREWEGKTVEEWYGNYYLKKYKELSNNENN